MLQRQTTILRVVLAILCCGWASGTAVSILDISGNLLNFCTLRSDNKVQCSGIRGVDHRTQRVVSMEYEDIFTGQRFYELGNTGSDKVNVMTYM
jgi:hypothetical protein